ncbi:hypothetical protein BHE74_00040893, partial [Ensete ventricosum]
NAAAGMWGLPPVLCEVVACVASTARGCLHVRSSLDVAVAYARPTGSSVT